MAQKQSIDNTKKVFDSYITGIHSTILNTTLCEQNKLREEYTWIASGSEWPTASLLRADSFGRLSKDDIHAIVTADTERKDKDYEIQQLILAWSTKSPEEATVRHFLLEVHILDEVELLENLCQKLGSSSGIGQESSTTSSYGPLPQSDHHGDRGLLHFHELKSVNDEVQSLGQIAMLPVQQAPKRDSQPKLPIMKPVQEQTKPTSDHSKEKYSDVVVLGDTVAYEALASKVDDLAIKLDRALKVESHNKLFAEELLQTNSVLIRQIKKLEAEVAVKKKIILNMRTKWNIREDEPMEEVQHVQEEEVDDDDFQEMNANMTMRYRKRLEELESVVIKMDNEIKDLKKQIEILKDRKVHCPNSEDMKVIRIGSEKLRLVDLDWNYVKCDDDELDILGEGSFGRVYKGKCVETGKHLAIKIIRVTDKQVAEAVLREVHTLAKLERHDRIVSYLDACYGSHPKEEGLFLQIFTEFMPGRSLRHFINENQRTGLKRKLIRRYTRQILQGAEYLHNEAVSKPVIIHRDIKGHNILCDLNGHVKLADFGCAEEENQNPNLVRVTYRKGTLQWMAPEVFMKSPPTTKSDIWSIGCTVVEMLTCEDPYAADHLDRKEIEKQVKAGQLNPLTSHEMRRRRYGLDNEVQPFLNECFRMEGENRSSATQLLSFKFSQQPTSKE